MVVEITGSSSHVSSGFLLGLVASSLLTVDMDGLVAVHKVSLRTHIYTFI